MPQDILKEDVNYGAIVYEWQVKEYEKYLRDRRWYIATAVAGLLFLTYAVVTGNYLFALILVLFGIILFLHDIQEAPLVPFAIAETGIIVGRKFYRYSELADFWIIYNPPAVKTLYFSTGRFMKSRLNIPLLDIDPRPIRDYLGQYLSENLNEEEEPVSDRFVRLMKLH